MIELIIALACFAIIGIALTFVFTSLHYDGKIKETTEAHRAACRRYENMINKIKDDCGKNHIEGRPKLWY